MLIIFDAIYFSAINLEFVKICSYLEKVIQRQVMLNIIKQ